MLMQRINKCVKVVSIDTEKLFGKIQHHGLQGKKSAK